MTDPSSIIAAVSAGVALVSAVLAGLTWRTSRRAAAASERSATAAERSVEFASTTATVAERTATREQELHDAQGATNAALVTFSMSAVGALELEVTNDGPTPVVAVVVDSVASTVAPRARWRATSGPAHWEALGPGASVRCGIEFVDPLTGAVHGREGTRYSVTISFTDVHDCRWRAVDGGVARVHRT